MAKNLGDLFNDFKHDLQTVQLPTVKGDVEVKPSSSLILLVGGIMFSIWLIFGKK
jgi:hypothetical protein